MRYALCPLCGSGLGLSESLFVSDGTYEELPEYHAHHIRGQFIRPVLTGVYRPPMK